MRPRAVSCTEGAGRTALRLADVLLGLGRFGDALELAGRNLDDVEEALDVVVDIEEASLAFERVEAVFQLGDQVVVSDQGLQLLGNREEPIS